MRSFFLLLYIKFHITSEIVFLLLQVILKAHLILSSSDYLYI